MRILIRTSKWSIWSRRLGSLSIPLLIIPVFMHRSELITSDQFTLIEAVALGAAALGLLCGIAAFVRIWSTGDRGWGKAMLGSFLSLLCLTPLAIAGYAAYRYPQVTDVSTDWTNPPVLISAFQRPPVALDAGQTAAIFPNARTRNYLLDSDQLFALVETEVKAQGWQVMSTSVSAGLPTAVQLNATAQTLLGWKDEVSIDIRPDADGSSLAMRSASLTGIHDFGANGLRIEAFMVAIDNAVTALVRDTPVAVPAEDSAEPQEVTTGEDGALENAVEPPPAEEVTPDALAPAPEG